MIRNLDNFNYQLHFKYSDVALTLNGVGFCVDFEHQGCREPQNSDEANKSPRFELKTNLARTLQGNKYV